MVSARSLSHGIFAAVLVASNMSGCGMPREPDFTIAVFTRTEGYRHGSIPAGLLMMERIGAANGFGILSTENPESLISRLDEVEAVVFLNTTGDVLDEAQQDALRTYVLGGGGFVGIHAATDTEYGWDWYGDLIGGRFNGHPDVQDAVVSKTSESHPSTNHLPESWSVRDEWYDFTDVAPGNVVLLSLDESSYEGGGMGANHPIAWYRTVGSGRSWYLGMGHASETYADPDFLTMTAGGILWAAGRTSP